MLIDNHVHAYRQEQYVDFLEGFTDALFTSTSSELVHYPRRVAALLAWIICSVVCI